MAIFRVLFPRKGLPPEKVEPYVYVLRPDSWNDFGLRTTFHLSMIGTEGDEVPIGTVKILGRGQQQGLTPLPNRFESLGGEFASLGAETDYYQNLLQVAGAQARSILASLSDIATNPALRRRFENEVGLEKSLLRFTPARTALEEAESIIERTASEVPTNHDLAFDTSTGGQRFSVTFDFGPSLSLPGRVNVLIGPNGSGKTRLLANLAMTAFDPHESGSGHLTGNVAVSRVLAFSYSAFDDFDVPGENVTQKRRFLRTGSTLGYSYFGLRDLAAARADTTARSLNPLKSTRRISSDFARALSDIADDDMDLFRGSLDTLFAEASFGTAALLDRQEILSMSSTKLRGELRQIFRVASTGHKFVLLMTAQLAANLRPGTLILVDEPEAHLHPPLLAVFLKVLRHLLENRDSNAIIATHSPFIVQETPSRHVRIISRQVTMTTVDKPLRETFGEDIGTISREVFRLDTRVGEYVQTLHELAARHTLNEIEAMFENGLSGQGRALVMAHQARRSPGR
ncbi:AAA family ATPase [Caulobacter sp. 17J65-9]|uniref:ATP-dependent nuclease n=1 Tax=Caulobacter sp. 17J65-9 TaxID=2709382 RepID=UPI0013C735D7|nr:AAA family ATPase [Caulobacter sp. 17J65-9]NEX92966.1 AAA family ATPase [Caulobacter sp. 17J65-9]